MAEEKSGCQKFLSAIWQFPIFSIAFLGVAAVSSCMMYKDSADLQDAVNTALAKDVTNFKSGLLWTLIGIFVIDGGITFMSLISSKWVHDCCWDKQMQKCACCTQFICYILNWFLFGMAYLLGLLSLVLTGVGSIIIIFGVSANGLCTGRSDGSVTDADIMAMVNKMLKALHDWVCDNSSDIDCSEFPSEITEQQVENFCKGTKDITNIGGKFFLYICMMIVAQWSFAIIQRANLVEGAVRRDMAKENNKKSDDGNEMGRVEYAGGPNV